MTDAVLDLATLYAAYLDCLNRRDWDALGDHVADDVVHDDRPFGLAGYRAMLERDVEQVPDLRFVAELLVVDDTRVAARLAFDCTPVGEFLGLPVNGRRVTFAENVFYEFRGSLVARVWSVVDKAALETQLR